MRSLLCILSCITLLFSLSACSSQASPGASEAVDAYTQYVGLLKTCSDSPENCDSESIWNMLDAKSKMQFVEAYVALVRMDKIIEQYFDPIEHKQMRRRTGTDILMSGPIKSEQDLFRHIFHPEAIHLNEKQISGLEYADDVVENANNVIIKTHQNGQVFGMHRESDGVWRTSGFLAAIAASVDPIMKSDSEMKEYAKSFFADELERRTKVRDYFLTQQEVQRRQAELLKNL